MMGKKYFIQHGIFNIYIIIKTGHICTITYKNYYSLFNIGICYYIKQVAEYSYKIKLF